MENKNKRLEKNLKKREMSQWVKPASDNDPVDFVMIEYPKCLRNSILFRAKDYIELVREVNIISQGRSLFTILLFVIKEIDKI